MSGRTLAEAPQAASAVPAAPAGIRFQNTARPGAACAQENGTKRHPALDGGLPRSPVPLGRPEVGIAPLLTSSAMCPDEKVSLSSGKGRRTNHKTGLAESPSQVCHPRAQVAGRVRCWKGGGPRPRRAHGDGAFRLPGKEVSSYTFISYNRG